MTPSPENTIPHLLDLSPSDHLSDHKALPLPGKSLQDSQEQEQSLDDYPDRSTYQELPDTPGTPPTTDPFAAAVSLSAVNAGPIPCEPDLVAEAEVDDEVDYDIGSIRGDYRRTSSLYTAPPPGFVRRDIGIIRGSSATSPALAKPLSPVLSLVGGDIKREKGGYATRSTPPPPPLTVASPLQQSLRPHSSPIQAPAGSHSPTHTRSADIPSQSTHHTSFPIVDLPEQIESNGEHHSQHNASDVSESISEVSTLSSASMEEEESWISAFCNVIGHEYFAEVTEDFIEDDFNLTGLGAVVPMYKEALEMILDVEPEDDSDSLGSASESLSENPTGTAYRRQRGHARTVSDYSVIETSAEMLYGLIHQRFITSRQGIQVMYDKYLANHFGFCPRVNCNSSRVLPCGYSDTPGTETVKLFCPSCCDIYVPPNSRFQAVDGAYFGTTFPSLFLMTFPELDISGNGRKEIQTSASLNSAGGRKGTQNNTLPAINGVPANNIAPGLGKGKKYEMKIYGFRVNERSKSGPRMGWLREKPDDLLELDELNRFTAGELEGYESDEEEDGMHSDEEEDDDDEDDDEEMGFPGGGAIPTGGGGAGSVQTRSSRRAEREADTNSVGEIR